MVKGRIPREPGGKLRWLTPAEAQALMSAAAANKRAPYLADFICLALNSGLRNAELLGLEWSRVDTRHRLVYFAPEDQKNASHGSVPLNDRAIASLESLRGTHERWVFAYRGRPIASVKKSFRSACEQAGIENCTPHTLRHTVAAWLVQSGVPLRTVSDILRHPDIQTTMRYAHLSPDNARSGIDALAVCQNVPQNRQTVPQRGTFDQELTNHIS